MSIASDEGRQRVSRSVADARAVAEAILRDHDGADGVGRVIIGEPERMGGYWVFGYQSRAFVETGDCMTALAGNGPIAVPVDERAATIILGTASSAREQLEAP